MSKYRKKPVEIEATRWHRNGDHPQDNTHKVTPVKGTPFNSEGKVVRYYRHPSVDDHKHCEYCDEQMRDHGWIDTPQGGHTVCPGDWIITELPGQGEGQYYPCKPETFEATYEKVE